MKGFIKNLASEAGEIKLRSMVRKITKADDLFLIHTDQGIYKTKNVISSLPRNNNLKLLNRTGSQENKDLWSAFTLYFTIPQIELESLYYQIHTEKIPYLETKSFFVSFSHPDDHKRNHHQRMTVTISSHAQFELFENLTPEDYTLKKMIITNFIIQKFCENFKLEKQSIDHLESGTPKTFEFYTNRHRGEVGGIGHHIDQSLMSRVYFKDLAPNFYEIGDHVMPGQGIAAVLYGSLALKAHLDRKN
jgi:phytoene dehydrogenase-like protein